MTEQRPTTEAGKRYLAERTGPRYINPDESDDDFAARMVLAIEAEAESSLRARLAAEVERLIEEAGGRCRKPDDYEDGGMNVCAQHSELLWDEGCEDEPREFLAVLRAISGDEP